VVSGCGGFSGEWVVWIFGERSGGFNNENAFKNTKGRERRGRIRARDERDKVVVRIADRAQGVKA